MIYRFLSGLLEPLTMLTLLSLLAYAALWYRRRERRRRLVMMGLPIIALTIASTPIASFLALGSLEWQVPRRTDPEAEERAEAIVVLSGGMIPPDVGRPRALPAPDTFWRCLHAAELHRRLGGRPILVSGGKVDPTQAGPTLAELMRELLIAQGVAPADLILEERSRSTYENAVECQKLLDRRGLDAVLLVTEAYHMPRALACFRARGVDAIPSSCFPRATTLKPSIKLFLPTVSAAGGCDQALHEWLGLAWYAIQGRI